MGLLPNWHAGYRVLTAIVPAATAQQRHDFLAKHANLLLQLMWAGIQDDHQINDKSRDSLTMLQTLLNLLGFGRDYTLSPNGAPNGHVSCEKDAELLFAVKPPVLLAILEALIRHAATWRSVGVACLLLRIMLFSTSTEGRRVQAKHHYLHKKSVAVPFASLLASLSKVLTLP
eukprot:jgi/Chrzof1/14253/Cz08g31050.t1